MPRIPVSLPKAIDWYNWYNGVCGAPRPVPGHLSEEASPPLNETIAAKADNFFRRPALLPRGVPLTEYVTDLADNVVYARNMICRPRYNLTQTWFQDQMHEQLNRYQHLNLMNENNQKQHAITVNQAGVISRKSGASVGKFCDDVQFLLFFGFIKRDYLILLL